MPIARSTAPIAAADERLREALDHCHLPSLLPALPQATGDLSLLRDDLRPRVAAAAAGRALARAAGDRPRARARGAAPPSRCAVLLHGARLRRGAHAPHAADDRRRGGPRVPPAPPRGARPLRRGPPRPRLTQGPRGRLPRRDHRRRHVGHPRRHPTQAGRRAVHDPREERGRRRRLARERLPRRARRRLEHLLLLLVRAARRPAHPLLDPRRAARRLPRVRRSVRRTRARALPHGGRLGALRRGARALVAARGRRRRPRGDARGTSSDLGGGPAQPAEDAGHPGDAGVRGAVVPLGALGSRRRPARQARRGARHRGERRAVRAGDRGRRRRAEDLPAHATVARERPARPRRDPRGAALALRARAALRALVPLLAVLDDRRGAAPRGARRPRLERRWAIRELGERSVPGAHDGYLEQQFADRPDLLEKVVPAYPPAAKHTVLDNGIWARRLERDHVE